MKSEVELSTRRKIELKEITRQVRDAVEKGGIRNGICVVFNPHTTAGLVINENADPDVASDLERAFEKMVPSIDFRHAEGNSPAHLLASVTRPSLQVIVEDGKLQLGTWQGIYFCEFDGPRRRKVWIKVIGD